MEKRCTTEVEKIEKKIKEIDENIADLFNEKLEVENLHLLAQLRARRSFYSQLKSQLFYKTTWA